MNVERLLNVAKALRESPNPDAFSMGWFAKSCGTPMCALGHYAARRDLQDTFELRPGSDAAYYVSGGQVFITAPAVLGHFGIDRDEAEVLFDSIGCGRAKTVEQAASFIERFAAGELTEQELMVPSDDDGDEYGGDDE